jgi:hypothetical protein
MLEIVIHRHQEITVCESQAFNDGPKLALVSSKAKHLDPHMFTGQTLQCCPRFLICTRVIDENQLPSLTGLVPHVIKIARYNL